MYSNKLRGTWDQVKGLSRELWGEMSGNEREYRAGHRQRLIGKLEANRDLSRDEAAQQVDQRQE